MKFNLSEHKLNHEATETKDVNGITVKTYLPYLKKIDFAEEVQRNVVRIDEETGQAYAGFNEDLQLTINILKAYTDLEFDEADAVDLYDYVTESGVMVEVCSAIGPDLERAKDIYYHLKSDILMINMQQLSTSQILKGLVELANSKDFADALSNMKLESESMLNVLGRAQQPTSLLNFAKK